MRNPKRNGQVRIVQWNIYLKQIIAVDLMHTVGLLLVGEEDGALLGLVLGGLKQ